MNLNTFSVRISQGQFYQTPVAEVFIVVSEETLATSNLEPIGGGDDPDIDW